MIRRFLERTRNFLEHLQCDLELGAPAKEAIRDAWECREWTVRERAVIEVACRNGTGVMVMPDGGIRAPIVTPGGWVIPGTGSL